MNSEQRIVSIPIDNRALEDIERLLATNDVFTTTFPHLGLAVFQAETYLRQYIEHQTDSVFLLDRNLLTRLISLARGASATDAHRIAAAVHAFAQTTDSLVEPNMALYEFAETGGEELALSELVEFRRLDNTHPQYLADIATGRVNTLEADCQFDIANVKPVSVDLTMRLRSWRACYTAALKIASLELTRSSAENKLLALMTWMQDEFLFISSALGLAIQYLAPNGPRKRRIKWLRSSDRDKAIRGIRNAAWDLALISEWAEKAVKQRDGDRLWILASMDRGLHDVARGVLAPGKTEPEATELLQARFVALWGSGCGKRLHSSYLACMRHREANLRSRRKLTGDEAQRMIDSLEAEVRAYRH